MAPKSRDPKSAAGFEGLAGSWRSRGFAVCQNLQDRRRRRQTGGRPARWRTTFLTWRNVAEGGGASMDQLPGPSAALGAYGFDAPLRSGGSCSFRRRAPHSSMRQRSPGWGESFGNVFSGGGEPRQRFHDGPARAVASAIVAKFLPRTVPFPEGEQRSGAAVSAVGAGCADVRARSRRRSASAAAERAANADSSS